MFRPTRKRPKKTRIVTSRDNGDDKDGSSSEEAVVVKRPKKKAKKQKEKSRRVQTMSFTMEEEEEVPKGRKRRKARGGMGYGGAAAVMASNDDDEPHDYDRDKDSSEALYGKDALEALKSQQRYKEPEEEEASPEEKYVTSREDAEKSSPSAPTLGSFVPLDSSKQQHTAEEEPVILTGEEAMSYGNNEKEDASLLEPRIPLSEESKETQAWQAEVARRAGIRTSKHEAPSLSQLQQQVLSTVTHLQTQQHDLQQAHGRRLVDLSRTQAELERHQEELKKHGNALEYYQQLRQDLAAWVGALRDLLGKVKPLEQAVVELDVEACLASSRWQEWQDDMVLVLSKANVLDRVLGRQVIQDTVSAGENEEKLVDEFGRDVKSQKELEREKRTRQRRQIRDQWLKKQSNAGPVDEISDACASEGEFEERKERRSALVEALHVAMQDLDEEYTSLSGLFRVFDEWSRSYPEEYKQCFAALSLADLAGVLVRVDLCSAFHPLHWMDAATLQGAETPQLPWLHQLHQAGQETTETDNAEETPNQHVLDNVLVPAIFELLDKNAYNVFSTKQSRSLSSFCSQLCSVAPSSRSVSRLKVRVVQYLRQSLDSVSIPIIKAGSSADINGTDSNDVREAREFVTKDQVYRVKKLLVNVLRWWAPVLGDLLIEPVLDFVSSRFLFLLSSLQAEDSSSNVGSDAFRQFWAAIQDTKWLERADLMLQAAPIRAAAVAYGQS